MMTKKRNAEKTVRDTRSMSRKRYQAMSVIDLTVVLVMLAVVAALVYFNDIPFKAIALGWIGCIALLMPLWLYNDHKDRMKLKQRYESGELEKDSYLYQVGKRFYNRHHGNE